MAKHVGIFPPLSLQPPCDGFNVRYFTLQSASCLKAGKSGDFAGLRRIGDPNDGTALWTTLTDPQEIKSALEARTREREAELRAGNKYMQAQAAEDLARQTTTVREDKKAAVPEVAPRARVEATEAKSRDEAEMERGETESARAVTEAAQGDKHPGGCCSVL